jgi:beta-lactam-binding protein with PASTA domain
VPTVKGKTLAAAERIIKAQDCSIGRITHRASQRVKKGHVLSQRPRPSAELTRGAKVSLVVSKGGR